MEYSQIAELLGRWVPVTDREYIKRIRRHAPSSLLPLIAATAAEFWEEGSWFRDRHRTYTPWALADAARVSILYGNEYGSEPATEDDLLQIIAAYDAFEDKALSMRASREERIEQFMLRMFGQQRIWRGQAFNEFARSAALLTQTPPNKVPRIMQPGWDAAMLGCSLSEYVGVAQVLLTSAVKYAGRFSPALLDGPDCAPICQFVPRQKLLRIVDAHFALSPDAFRQEARVAQHSGPIDLRRYEYNPLHGRPFLTGYGPGYLTPCPRAIIEKASPIGLYYTGVKRYGNAFAQDFGELLEQYVGRQLRLMPGVTLIPEIPYKVGRRQLWSVDWIAVFNNLVLLIEVKSKRPTHDVRLATDRRVSKLRDMLAHAYTQIETTAQMIISQWPGFTAIPYDRPIRGLIITQEPFYFGNTEYQRQYMPVSSVPTMIAGVRELEESVTITGIAIDQFLRDLLTDKERSKWGLESALGSYQRTPNSVLHQAWTSYPWRERLD